MLDLHHPHGFPSTVLAAWCLTQLRSPLFDPRQCMIFVMFCLLSHNSRNAMLIHGLHSTGLHLAVTCDIRSPCVVLGVPGYFVLFSRVCADSAHYTVFSTDSSACVTRRNTRGFSRLDIEHGARPAGPTVEELAFFFLGGKRSRTITATKQMPLLRCFKCCRSGQYSCVTELVCLWLVGLPPVFRPFSVAGLRTGKSLFPRR